MAASEGTALAIPWFVLVFGGPYVVWSIYWGLVWYLNNAQSHLETPENPVLKQ
jgi:hypothetical protein